MVWWVLSGLGGVSTVPIDAAVVNSEFAVAIIVLKTRVANT